MNMTFEEKGSHASVAGSGFATVEFYLAAAGLERHIEDYLAENGAALDRKTRLFLANIRDSVEVMAFRAAGLMHARYEGTQPIDP